MSADSEPGAGTAEDGTSPRADPPGLDRAALLGWLAEHSPGLLADPVRARLLFGGRSNLTYLLDDGRRRVVLRRPPLGHVQATAHDMSREYRVMRALAGTAVPVPEALALCSDPDVIGAPFYLMSFVDGAVLRRAADLDGLDRDGRAAVARTMMDVLADLHAVDPAAVGLAEFGRPDGFLARQVRRWSIQLDGSRSRELPGIERLRDRLAASVPEPGTGTGSAPNSASGSNSASVANPVAGCLVHGDYRLDNLVVSPPAQGLPVTVRAVLDWEMSTLGDPLVDLGLLLAYWDGLGGAEQPIADALGPAAGFPTGQVLTEWYAARSDRPLDRLPWYVGFGFFKIAVILEGIHFRYAQGQTVGPGFEQIGTLVPGLVERGLAALGEP